MRLNVRHRQARLVDADATARSTARPRTPAGRSTSATTAARSTALDARDGRGPLAGAIVLAASGTGREYFYATPTVAYGRVFASNTDGTVYAFGAGTGNLLWARHVGTYVYTAPAVWEQKVYVGTYDGKFYALDAATGDTRWVREMPAAVHGAPTVMDGLVYLSTCGSCGQKGVRSAKKGPNGTYALDARTGKLVWRFPDGQYSPLVADGETGLPRRRDAGLRAGIAALLALSEQERDRDPRRAARRGTTSGRRGR